MDPDRTEAAEPAPLTVALAAAPPLLAGSLRVLLEGERTQVEILLAPVERRFDVAIVTRDSGVPVSAGRHIVLDDDLASQGGGVVVGPGEPVRLPDIEALRRYVDTLATGHLTGPPRVER
jgi:hypothetical protein